ncbi:uncharacterized protein [Eurosta solidaginis]|uniref:uncharacterized protein isoform X2 n=1 Tax=Eurosta solidaginis TaxID=178769 RepID=UPI0035312E24
MMAEFHRLPDQKYTEADYLFQTIEMAKSDEEYDVELCTTPPLQTGEMYDLELVPQEPSIFSWKVVKRRQRPHRRNTVSHGGAPPAPPSTPTSLTANNTPVPSPTASNNLNANGNADDEPLNSLLYILDYAPKYKKKLKEQQRTDAELAELFNVITITSSGVGGSGGGGASSSGSNANNAGGTLSDGNSSKLLPERGISANSRVIRKHDANTKIFKIHRNPKEFFRESGNIMGVAGEGGGEDSVSAPEYDDVEEEEIARFRRTAPIKLSSTMRDFIPSVKHFRYRVQTKRERRLAKFTRFEHQERMDSMMENFDAAMKMNDV